MEGILRCSRYAFGPNRLHYCGPEQNPELLAYINNDSRDQGLKDILGAFKTMYPYLLLIAHANGIKNPFDEKVVEAYWLGNRLLDAVPKKKIYSHLLDGLNMKHKIGTISFDIVADKLRHGAVPHHSFHVLDIWKRTGNLEIEHTLESMDSCRISWGKVINTNGPHITVETEPLIIQNGKLFLGQAIIKNLTRRLEATYDIEQLKPGQLVSIHWSVPCEVISPRQATALKKYTQIHIDLANLTI